MSDIEGGYINNSGLTEENEQADRNGTISLGDVIQFDWTIYHMCKSKVNRRKYTRWILKIWYWKKRCVYCGWAFFYYCKEVRVKEEAEIAFSELVYYSGIYKTNTLITNEIINNTYKNNIKFCLDKINKVSNKFWYN